ncbi:hypothetical protein RRG08_054086 [Elysia crispata]|uniref:Uncharacterized protein n=1 Tax=Elysia crispata TaxID=231223 RepID=A0AAE1DF11_9GAST|nr:hypothetical protein RRG08_054086 [Elysia crispata]
MNVVFFLSLTAQAYFHPRINIRAGLSEAAVVGSLPVFAVTIRSNRLSVSVYVDEQIKEREFWESSQQSSASEQSSHWLRPFERDTLRSYLYKTSTSTSLNR